MQEHTITTTNIFVLPAQLKDCEPETQISTKVLVNLKVSYAFFNESQLLSFDGSSILPRPINVSLPNFNFYLHNVHNVSASHGQGAKLHMEKLADLIKKDKQLFYNHQNEMQFCLFEIQGPITFDLANWKDVSIVSIFSLVTLLTLFTIYLLCKISKLSALLAAILAADATENVSNPTFLIYGQKDFVAKSQSNSTIPVNCQIDLVYHATTMQLILAMVAISVLFAISIRLCRKHPRTRNSFGCQLFFNIAADHESVWIGGQKFGDIVKNYGFVCNSFITNMEVSKLLNPTPNISWDLQITHFFSDRIIAFQNKIPISFSQLRKAKRILATRKYMVIVLIQDEHFEFEPISLKRKVEGEQAKLTESFDTRIVAKNDIQTLE